MQPESTKNFSGAYQCCRWQPTDPREIAERQSSVFREPLIQTVQSTTRRFKLSKSNLSKDDRYYCFCESSLFKKFF